MLSLVEIEMLKKEGWIKKNIGISSKEEIIQIGELLGKPIPSRVSGDLVDELRPTGIEEAKKNSLSSLYGKNRFPLHTDTAYKTIPIRYLILYAKNPGGGKRPTLLVDGLKLIDSGMDKNLLLSAIFKIKNGKYSFLGKMFEIDKMEEVYRIRLDQGCMIPATKESRMIFEQYVSVLDRQKKIEVKWESGDLLVLDNWRMLHGRGNSATEDDDRLLFRLNIS